MTLNGLFKETYMHVLERMVETDRLKNGLYDQFRLQVISRLWPQIGETSPSSRVKQLLVEELNDRCEE